MAQTSSVTNAHYGGGQVRQIADTAANDSDKALTVPAGKVWHVLHVWASLAATATAGNRQVELLVRDDADATLGIFAALNVQAESTTEYYVWGTAGTVDEAKAGYHFMPLSPVLLPPGYDLRIYDSAAIDAAADDLTIRALVIEYDD